MNDKKEENTKKTETESKKTIQGLIIIIVLIIVVFKACGNGNNCKERWCRRELYKDGYCRDHFLEHYTDAIMDSIYQPDYGR